MLQLESINKESGYVVEKSTIASAFVYYLSNLNPSKREEILEKWCTEARISIKEVLNYFASGISMTGHLEIWEADFFIIKEVNMVFLLI